MAGRNRMPRQPDNFRGFRDGPPPRVIMQRGPGPLPPHPSVLEEELELQHRDMQRFIAENRQVIDENVMLERELSAVKDDIHRLSQVIPKMRADNEAQLREYIERGMKLEADLRSTEPLRLEVIQLRAESQKLISLQKELSAQVQTLTNDTNRLQTENKQLSAMKTDIAKLQKELAEARRQFEYEKKANTELVEQNQSMEKNLISMAREIEKLRADKVGRGLGVGAYGMMNGSPEMRYPGGAYGDPYSGGGWGSYDNRGPPRR
ncbi:hypothetical protein MTR67_021609 [Solanum verrucosum]|nr:protein FLX-like 3 [Solanum verrucosum]XP_049404534.1 protein FLX-like 3 isoform X2 [Solanum stenotomum]WMV28224.1 hypothetical protein MTR67_021609 [Solanum verrucosum]